MLIFFYICFHKKHCICHVLPLLQLEMSQTNYFLENEQCSPIFAFFCICGNNSWRCEMHWEKPSLLRNPLHDYWKLWEEPQNTKSNLTFHHLKNVKYFLQDWKSCCEFCILIYFCLTCFFWKRRFTNGHVGSVIPCVAF